MLSHALRTLLISFLALMFVTGCTGIKVKENVHGSAQLEASKTYSWKSAPVTDRGLASEDSVSFDQLVRLEVERSLANKGYSKVDEGGDFQVDYLITVVPGSDVAVAGSSQGMAGSVHGRLEDTSMFESSGPAYLDRGYLALTAYGPEQKIWWEVVGNKVTEPGASETQVERVVRKAVNKMMAGFPKAAR